MQKKLVSLEKEKKELIEKSARLESDKVKLSEKWLRLSSRAKQEQGLRDKLREAEIAREKEVREKNDLEKQLVSVEKENTALKEVIEKLGSSRTKTRSFESARRKKWRTPSNRAPWRVNSRRLLR